MNIINRNITIFTLLLSGIMLSSLVPGGPIENRDFSHINPGILLGFNIFLTILGLGSFVLIPFLWKQKKLALKLSLLAGASYLLVYGVDLLGYFPKTPTPMSAPLFWVEVIGSIIAIPIMVLSCRQLRGNSQQSEKTAKIFIDKKASIFSVITLMFVGSIIVVFATLSAMS